MGKIPDLTQLFRRDEWSWQFSTVFDDSCTKLQPNMLGQHIPTAYLMISSLCSSSVAFCQQYLGVLSENPQVITAQTLRKADLCQTGRFYLQPLAISVSSSHGFPYLLGTCYHSPLCHHHQGTCRWSRSARWTVGHRSTPPWEEGWVVLCH